MISAAEALHRLREGNRQFASDADDTKVRHRPDPTLTQQSPFAIILGCSDSRVPAEIVFNQGLGDLFVIRVAGNIVAPSLIGSVEFAAASFGTRLAVVLGHSQCGAVEAALNELEDEQRSPNIAAIVDRIRPGIEPVMAANHTDRQARLSAAVRANIETSTEQLRHGSEILSRLAEEDGLMIVGAEYCLETGVVEFLDG
jgi:carbonic anhydrase